MGDFDGSDRFMSRMDSAKFFQLIVIETLYSDRQAGDAEIIEFCESFAFKRAGIGFQRNFKVVLQDDLLPNAGQQSVE